jgi:hypothetical protein
VIYFAKKDLATRKPGGPPLWWDGSHPTVAAFGIDKVVSFLCAAESVRLINQCGGDYRGGFDMKRMLALVFVLASIGSLQTGCASHREARLKTVEKVLGPGWECYAAPDAFKKAGVVVERDRNGIVYYYSDHSDQSVSGTAAIGDTDLSIDTEIGTLLKADESLTATVDAAEAAADLNRSIAVTARYQGTVKHVVPGEDTMRILSHLSEVETPATNRYFLFRESISATSIDIIVQRSNLSTADIRASFESIIDASAKWSRHRDGEYRLVESFDTPIGVCVLPYELRIIRSADGTKRTVLSGRPVELPLATAISERKP